LLPAGAGVTILGGLVIEKMQLSCRQIIKMIASLSFAVTITAFIFLLRCDSVVFAGINVPYNVN
jgi:solute carrier organic anion transporter family, member 4A